MVCYYILLLCEWMLLDQKAKEFQPRSSTTTTIFIHKQYLHTSWCLIFYCRTCVFPMCNDDFLRTINWLFKNLRGGKSENLKRNTKNEDIRTENKNWKKSYIYKSRYHHFIKIIKKQNQIPSFLGPIEAFKIRRFYHCTPPPLIPPEKKNPKNPPW